MDRVNKLCALLDKCTTFADVGCDHGYCTQYMLKNGLCEKAVVADISAGSLSKAEKLLKNYINSGICAAVCCDGLQKIDPETELVLIAGMGGEEVVKILKEGFIPKNFVLQPMHNEALVREYLIQNGCCLTYDGIFYSGSKYYFVIKGKRGGGRTYTKAQLAYGKDSLGTPELINMLSAELAKIEEYLTRPLSGESRKSLAQKAQFIKGVLNGEIT